MRVGYDLVSGVPSDLPAGGLPDHPGRRSSGGDSALLGRAALTGRGGLGGAGTDREPWRSPGRARLHDTFTAVDARTGTRRPPSCTSWYANGRADRSRHPADPACSTTTRTASSRHRRGRGLAGGPFACGRRSPRPRPQVSHVDLHASTRRLPSPGDFVGRVRSSPPWRPVWIPTHRLHLFRGTSTTRPPVTTGATYEHRRRPTWARRSRSARPRARGSASTTSAHSRCGRRRWRGNSDAARRTSTCPKITGTPRKSPTPSTLRTRRAWKPSPALRDSSGPLDGVPIPDATGQTFTVPGECRTATRRSASQIAAAGSPSPRPDTRRWSTSCNRRPPAHRDAGQFYPKGAPSVLADARVDRRPDPHRAILARGTRSVST